jgi:hypothetical protein
MREKTAVFVIGNRKDVENMRNVLIPEPENIDK